MRKIIDENFPGLPEEIKDDMTKMATSQANREAAEMLTGNGTTNTLVPLSMKIISELHKNNPELRFVTAPAANYRQVSIKMEYDELQHVTVTIGADKIADAVTALAIESAIEEIDKEIKAVGARKLVSERLVQRIETIAEDTMAPKLYVRLNYDLIS